MPPPLRFLAFQRRRLLVRETGGTLEIASVEPELLGPVDVDLPLAHPRHPETRVVDLAADVEAPPGTVLRDTRRLLPLLSPELGRLVLRALHVVEWGRTHLFCGRCGAENDDVPDELTRRCPRCGHTTFPRISPAVIVRVARDSRILLSRSAHFPPGGYSVLAGFVEPGESLEETVSREVAEEVGIRLRNILYFGSQPWPFPDSLMLGFTATHAAGELDPDRTEIEDVRWFGLGELPAVPPAFSIARTLIDDWVQRQGGDPRGLPRWPV